MKQKIKTITLTFSLIFIGIGIFYACKKDDKARSLTNELIVLNNEIYSQIETQQTSKRWFWNTLAIASADILAGKEGGKIGGAIGFMVGGPKGLGVGAVVGGVVCGGGASYGVGAGLGVWKSIQDPYPDGYVSTLSSRYSDFNIAGALHNEYLDLLFKGSVNGNLDRQIVYNQIFRGVESLEVKIYNQIFEELGPNSKHSKEMLTLVNNYIENKFDIDIFLHEYKEKFGMSKEAEEIWSSFFSIYSSIVKFDDAYFVIEKYIDFIQEKGKDFLTNDEITSFNCALSVALHSTNYWSILN
ncbi:MAG: hypothetical protein FWE63_08010 [Bacteroidales bacterium]|nr:hypothetical protein [Bacteroidales bacterium]